MIIEAEDLENDFYLIAEGIYHIFSRTHSDDVEINARALTNEVLKSRDDYLAYCEKLRAKVKLGYVIVPSNNFVRSFSSGGAYLSMHVATSLTSIGSYNQRTSGYFHNCSLSVGWTKKGLHNLASNKYTNPLECLLMEAPKAAFNLDLLALPYAVTYKNYRQAEKDKMLILDLEKYLKNKKEIPNAQ